MNKIAYDLSIIKAYNSVQRPVPQPGENKASWAAKIKAYHKSMN